MDETPHWKSLLKETNPSIPRVEIVDSSAKRQLFVATMYIVFGSIVLKAVVNLVVARWILFWSEIVVALLVLSIAVLATRNYRLVVLGNVWAVILLTFVFILISQSDGELSPIIACFAIFAVVIGLILPPTNAYIWVIIFSIAQFVGIYEFTPRTERFDAVIATSIGNQFLAVSVIWFSTLIQQRFKKVLEEKNKRNEMLLKVISHDIRNSLQLIVSMTERLERKPEAVNAAVPVLKRAGDTITSIIMHATEHLAVGNDQLSLAIAPSDMSLVVSNTLNDFRQRAEEKSVRFELKKSGNDPFPAAIDADRFRQQVLGNIVSNAVKFSPPGACVRISISKIKGFIAINVIDSGEGISKIQASKILSSAPIDKRRGTSGESGLGFGLSIALSYLRAMRGSLKFRGRSANSIHKKYGTIVRILVPRR